MTTLWAASDGMALGASESIQHLKRKVTIGGIDWTLEGVKAVNEQILTATVGGHFMEGAWISVLIYDYFHGIRFSQENEINFASWMALINKKQFSEIFQFLMDKKSWEKIEFKNCQKLIILSLKPMIFLKKIYKI